MTKEQGSLQRPETIPLLRPKMPTPAELLPWLEKMHEQGWFTNFGPLNKELEKRLAESHGGGPGVQVCTASSGTAAVSLAIRALELPPSARILLPSLTFPGTATAILEAGHLPVFADVDEATWQLTPSMAREEIEETAIDAVLPVAVFGRPVDADAWDEFTATTGIPAVVDAAGAFGDQKIGRTTHAAFSLHATKALAVGEGGFVSSRDPDFVLRARRLSNFGFERGLVRKAGTNAKMSEYHAAVGLAALEGWPRLGWRRRMLAARYARLTERLGKAAQLPAGHWNWVRSVWVLRLPGGAQDSLVEALAAHGIESRKWYCPPLHRHPAFADYPLAGRLGVTEALASQLLGLPFHPGIDRNALGRIEDCLQRHLSPS